MTIKFLIIEKCEERFTQSAGRFTQSPRKNQFKYENRQIIYFKRSAKSPFFTTYYILHTFFNHRFSQRHAQSTTELLFDNGRIKTLCESPSADGLCYTAVNFWKPTKTMHVALAKKTRTIRDLFVYPLRLVRSWRFILCKNTGSKRV